MENKFQNVTNHVILLSTLILIDSAILETLYRFYNVEYKMFILIFMLHSKLYYTTNIDYRRYILD